MSNKTTYRFFVNDKRVATAIFWEKEQCVLEVFPLQNTMIHSRAGKTERHQLTFDSEEKWRAHCERDYNPKPVTTVEVTKHEVKETTMSAPVFQQKKNWICPPCGKGPGHDHRMCICHAYNYSIADWEIAVGIRPPVPGTTPPASISSSQSSAKVNTADWACKEGVSKATLPPGKYYIGDLCYVLGDDLYDNILIKLGDCEDGLYTKKGKEDTEFFMVGGTAYGDGTYEDNNGKEYCVDAGIIGICPMTCVNKDDGGGQFYTFKNPVYCKIKDGIFTFESSDKYIRINTA